MCFKRREIQCAIQRPRQLLGRQKLDKHLPNDAALLPPLLQFSDGEIDEEEEEEEEEKGASGYNRNKGGRVVSGLHVSTATLFSQRVQLLRFSRKLSSKKASKFPFFCAVCKGYLRFFFS